MQMISMQNTSASASRKKIRKPHLRRRISSPSLLCDFPPAPFFTAPFTRLLGFCFMQQWLSDIILEEFQYGSTEIQHPQHNTYTLSIVEERQQNAATTTEKETDGTCRPAGFLQETKPSEKVGDLQTRRAPAKRAFFSPLSP